jgi:hypothetical protein
MLRHRSIQQCARIAMAIHIAEPKERAANVNTVIMPTTKLKLQSKACEKASLAHSARLKQFLQNAN